MSGNQRLVALIATATILAGCETMTHEDEGAIIGGVLGGVVGSQVGDGSGRTAAIIIGTLAGSMIGRHIGETMDDNDRMRSAQALNANPTGRSTAWVNPDTGRRYAITPTRTYDRAGAPCREFTLATGTAGSRDQETSGTACLRSDGVWELI